jgi:hypothetical protein
LAHTGSGSNLFFSAVAGFTPVRVSQ